MLGLLHRPLTRWIGLALTLLFASLASCTKRKNEVVVYTSVDQVFSEPVFRTFERETGIKVNAVFDTEETKSTGVLNRLIAEADHPQADVFWSGDPVRPFLLVKRGIAEPYLSPAASGGWAASTTPPEKRSPSRSR